MPQRTNLHQAVIYYVKRHYAPPEVEVTESKMMTDRDSREQREVDIVMEGMIGDEPVVISIEVSTGTRPKGTPWVESMLSKHDRMPTNRLVLVSWSGFTAPALTKVESQGGRVVALTPEVIPGATSNFNPFYLEVSTTPESAFIVVRDDDGALLRVTDVPMTLNIYAAPAHDAYLCMLGQIVNRFMNQEVVGRELLDQAYTSENREALTHFSHEMADLDDRGLYAHDGNLDRFRLISGWRIVGPVTLRQQAVEFTIMRLGDTVFAMTELQMGGRDAVWVLTPNTDGTDTATVSWRLV